MFPRLATTTTLALMLLIPGASSAAPTITNVSGTLTHGSTITVSGSEFGTRGDYNDINDTWHGHRYMNFRWTDFGFPTFSPDQSTYDADPSGTDGFYPQYGGAYWTAWGAEGLSLVAGGPAVSGRYLKRRVDPAAPRESGGSSVDMPGAADAYPTLFIQTDFMMDSPTIQQSGKFIRVWGDGAAGSIYFSSGGDSLVLRGDGSVEDCPVGFNGDGVQWGGASLFPLGEWSTVTVTMDKPSGMVSGYIDGTFQWSSKWWCDFGLGGHTIDFPNMIDEAFRGYGEDGSYNFTNTYVDFTLARVLLGNASTFSASTRRELQIPVSWGDGAITVALNRGSFAPSAAAYLYVVDSTGAVNATGYPVTVGGTPDETPPASPTGLAIQ